MNYQVRFQFEDGADVVACTAGDEDLLEVARRYNVMIDAPCSGNASCGKCRIRLTAGELDSPKTIHLSEEEYAQGWRLACISRAASDVTVKVPDLSADSSRMKITQEHIAAADVVCDNDIRVLHLVMNAPTLDDTMPDEERLRRAVCSTCGVKEAVVSFFVLRKLAEVLRENSFDVQCVVRLSRDCSCAEVLDITGAKEDCPVCGVAVDLGTTSVAAVLADLQTGSILARASAGNGQIRYGADVINRIIESVRPGGRKKLQDAIVKETLDPMIDKMCRAANIAPGSIYRMSVAGNTTMNHLLLGLYADPVRKEPYIPSFYETHSVCGQDLGLGIYPGAGVIIAPNTGSYVGGDITAGTYASGIFSRPQMSLLIDLGTNGELVLGNEEFMMSCACSAGPAFEGGDISCGMRAMDGAAWSVRIDRDTMEPEYRVIGGEDVKIAGICGSGIIDLVSELFRCGIIDPKGRFIRQGERIRYERYGMGSYVIAFKEEAGSVRDIQIDEADLDNFIRAKGAVFSAIRVMLGALDFTADMIDDVYVAGGIGSGINMKNAVSIGMLPDIPPEKFHYIGNASLAGACAMLLSDTVREKVSGIARNMTYLELSNEPSYMDEFVAACFLPHTDAGLFPSLKIR